MPERNATVRPGSRGRWAEQLLVLLAVLLPACASLEPFENFEPRARDPLPAQFAKGLLYVPVVAVGTVVVILLAVVDAEAEQRSFDVRVEQDLGRSDDEIDRAIF